MTARQLSDRPDPGETTNLAEAQPDRVLDMGRQLLAWQSAVKAQWPRPNLRELRFVRRD